MYATLYYFISAGLLATLIYLCRPVTTTYQSTSPFQTNTLFLTVALLLLILTRIPSIGYNRELNVDESQLLAQAITLQQDPIYGRSVDGTSIGPINTYLLLIPSALGLPLDYTSARLTALLLIASSLLLFYFSVLRLTTPFIGRISFLPVLLFFSWTTEPNFLHYSSELSSLVILTASFSLALGVLRQNTPPSVAGLAGLGVLAGLTVYCKLQTLPIVGMILFTLTLYLWSIQRWKVLKSLFVITAGFLVLNIAVFGQAYWFETEDYFIDYYFVGNLTTYAQIYAHVPLVSQSFIAKLARFPAFLVHYADFLIFIVFNCCLVITATLLAERFQWRFKTSSPWVDLLTTLTILGALWAVVTPGTEFGHHLLLLVFPLSWGLALAIHKLMQSIPDPLIRQSVITTLIGLYILEVILTDNLLLAYGRQLMTRPIKATIKPTKSESTQDWLISSNPYLFSFPAKLVLPLSPVSQVIRRLTLPLDKIAVWGWNCQYYVETGLAQGVRENHTQRSIIPNRMRNAYLNRYAHDLVMNRPVVFVDAVGKASLILTKPQYRHEQFATINRIIQQNYSLVTSIKQVRIYVRQDRLHLFSQKVAINPLRSQIN
ncbi:hypothetical protein [Spirosoma validum]|uniref:Uncharacterized protein n=1 Tax=Spirosoma validum TaxID=2771355 RepID=A0A927AYP9_9BACT|nr:hypothetical protein [Spirosoma validum]MBD2752300.1 hypothetical protein [Spirosoma validum]